MHLTNTHQWPEYWNAHWMCLMPIAECILYNIGVIGVCWTSQDWAMSDSRLLFRKRTNCGAVTYDLYSEPKLSQHYIAMLHLFNKCCVNIVCPCEWVYNGFAYTWHMCWRISPLIVSVMILCVMRSKTCCLFTYYVPLLCVCHVRVQHQPLYFHWRVVRPDCVRNQCQYIDCTQFVK